VWRQRTKTAAATAASRRSGNGARRRAREEEEEEEEAARGAVRRVRSVHWSPYDRVGVVNAVP
jgi:hypothetical protein